MYKNDFRRLCWEIYWFLFKLGSIKKVLGLSPSRCFEYPLAVINLNLQKGEKLLDVGSGKSCFPLFMVKKRGVNLTLLDIDGRVMVHKRYTKKIGIINHAITYVRKMFGWSCILFALLLSLRNNANRNDAEFPYIVFEKS